MNNVWILIQNDTMAWVEQLDNGINAKQLPYMNDPRVWAVNVYTSKKLAYQHMEALNKNGIFKQYTQGEN